MENDLLRKLKELERKYEYHKYDPKDWTPEELQQLEEQDDQEDFDSSTI